MGWARILVSAPGLFATLASHADAHFEMSGKLAVEARAFTQSSLYAGQQQDHNLSLAVEPSWYWQWNDGNDSVNFTPFYRIDEHDSERQLGAIRELYWNHIGRGWELRLGLRREFWGVTEFRHLVDVINQTDVVGDFNGEEKFGQKMINLSLVEDWGILDLLVLPGFRARSFAGVAGRLRGPLVIDGNRARYQSADQDQHVDLAIRWSHTLDIFDLGLSGFHGTNRDPLLQPETVDGQSVLTPFYQQMTQFGLDAQATLDNVLWKLEAIWRDTEGGEYWDTQVGFEYTFYAVAASPADIGFLFEYSEDWHKKVAGTQSQNNVSFGARLTLNDIDSTEMLVGVNYRGKSAFVEFSRRFGQHWKASIDGWYLGADDKRDPLYAVRNDDHVQLTVEYYF